MSKKTKDKELANALDVAIHKLQEEIKPTTVEEKVWSFRQKGYNDNQIASLFGLPVQEVKEIK